MKSLIVASIFMVGLCHAHAHAQEQTEVNRLQAQCGNDILCYFSKEEVVQALGDNAKELAQSGILEITADPFGDEDEAAFSEETQSPLLITDFSASRRQVKKTGKHASKSGGVNTGTSAHTGAPIWGSFISNFRKCAPGCVPANIGTYGARNNSSPTAGRGNYTCHATGQAVDVGAIVCGGTAYRAISEISHAGKFTKFVGCMKGKMKVLWHKGMRMGITRGHYDHVHLSNGCTAADGNRWI